MTKVANIIEFIKNDVNKEESMILSIFQKMLQINFKLILLFGIPFIHLCGYERPSIGVKGFTIMRFYYHSWLYFLTLKLQLS